MNPASAQATRERITIERSDKAVNVTFHDAVIASTKDALLLKETGHEPVYYIPKAHVAMAFLTTSERRTTSPFKGEARYWSISAEGAAAKDAVWAYDTPHEGVAQIAGHLAFDTKLLRVTAA